ncbi:MAG: class I SAM-dependent methyltransferase, partial [Thermoguttaceae bacterium]
LAVARKRSEARGWKNVEAVSADATTFRPAEGPADVVTFSYSLTMIPDWFAAIDSALAMLQPGGTIGVTDFFVARKYPAEGRRRHSWFTRTFWPAWFGSDNVFLSADHIPYLQRNFRTERLEEKRAKVHYIPLIRVPYYTFIGRKLG